MLVAAGSRLLLSAARSRRLDEGAGTAGLKPADDGVTTAAFASDEFNFLSPFPTVPKPRPFIKLLDKRRDIEDAVTQGLPSWDCGDRVGDKEEIV